MYKCQKCSKEVIEKYGSGLFCSRSCANTRILSAETKERIRNSSIGHKVSEEIKSKIKASCKISCNKTDFISKQSETMKQYYKNNPEAIKNLSEYSKYHRVYSEATRQKLRESQLKLVKEGKHSGWISRKVLSYPEKYFIEVLKLHSLFDKCQVNYKIKKRDLGYNCNACYFLDFYFDEYKLDVEIDGARHKILEISEKDKLRDSLLQNNGYKVYRIEWKNPVNDINKMYIKTEIEKFLNYLSTLSN